MRTISLISICLMIAAMLVLPALFLTGCIKNEKIVKYDDNGLYYKHTTDEGDARIENLKARVTQDDNVIIDVSVGLSTTKQQDDLIKEITGICKQQPEVCTALTGALGVAVRALAGM